MAQVKVLIRSTDVIRALNTPGGAVREFVDEVSLDTLRYAEAASPVNDPLNAMHRGGVVGTYLAGWRFDRRGSRGHFVLGRVLNIAKHADIVEFGRGPAYTPIVSKEEGGQRFSWTVWGGVIRTVDYTGPRDGRHILRDALRQAYFFEVGLPRVTARRQAAASFRRRQGL